MNPEAGLYQSLPQSSLSITSIPPVDSLGFPLVNKSHDESLLKNSSDSFRRLRLTTAVDDVVVFGKMDDSYPTDADIETTVTFSSSEAGLRESGTIGLVPFPWKNLDDVLVTKSLANDGQENVIVFKPSDVPKDLLLPQYFQLCYLFPDGKVGGKSEVFRLYRPSNEDLVEIGNKSSDDESDDYVVIASEQALYQQRIKELTYKNGTLEFEIVSLKQENEKRMKDVAKLEQELSALKSEKAEMQKACNETNSNVLKRSKEIAEENLRQTEMLEKLQKDLDETRALLNQKEVEYSQLKAVKYLGSEHEIKCLKEREMRLNATISEELKGKALLHANFLQKTEDAEKFRKLYEESQNKNKLLEQIVSSHSSQYKSLSERFMTVEMQHKVKDDEYEQLVAALRQTIVQLETKLMGALEERDANLSAIKDLQGQKAISGRDTEELKEKVKQLQIICDAQADASSDLQNKMEEMRNRLEVASMEYQNIQREKFFLQKEFTRAKSKLEKYRNIVKSAKSDKDVEHSDLFTIDKGVVKKVEEVKIRNVKETTVGNQSDSLEGAVGGAVEDAFVINCEECGDDIPCFVNDKSALEDHMEEVHFKRGCPMCSRWYDTRLNEEYFRTHIESHFLDAADITDAKE